MIKYVALVLLIYIFAPNVNAFTAVEGGGKYTSVEETEDENPSREIYRNVLNFDSFANRHILDPAMFVNVSKLTAAELNLLIGQRAGFEQSSGTNDLRKKSMHIFLSGNPVDIKSSFHKGPYTTIFNESIPMTNTGISDRSFPIILMHKKGHSPRRPYNAWACGNKYLVAGLNRFNEPIYLQGVQDSPTLLFPFVTAPGLNPMDCARIP